MKLPSVAHHINWNSLRAFGNSRLIKTSYIWIVVVPLAAKMLLPVAGSHTFSILGASLTMTLGLPFSWQAFYFMALAFAAGQGIYAVQCPDIVRRFQSYSDYKEAHPGAGQLWRYLRYALTRMTRDEVNELHERVTDAFQDHNADNRYKEMESRRAEFESQDSASRRERLYKSYAVAILHWRGEDRVIGDCFDAIRRSSWSINRKSLVFADVLFALGFGLLLVVVGQNCLYVLRVIMAG